MGSGFGPSADHSRDRRRRAAGTPPGAAAGGDRLDGLDDADIADLWVVDEHTGEFRMRTPGEAAASGSASRPDSPRPASSRRRADAEESASAEAAPAASSPGRRRSEPAGRAASRRSGGAAAEAKGKPKSKVKKRLKWTAIGLVGLLVAIAGAGYAYYEYLNSRIKTGDRSGAVDAAKEAPADEQGRKPMNVLLVGSDNRVGAGNEGYGDAGHPGLADTTILLHLSADRSNATLVSIPRDTLVFRPACKEEGGSGKVQAAADRVPFNETMLAPYGTPCTVATVERMLGLKIDHWLKIEFKGVKEMTKAVGGVPVNLCDPLEDPFTTNPPGGTGLSLPAGETRLAGEDALKFVRARHGFKNDSDLGRIEAQKSFLMALAREIKTSATWKDPQAVLQIAQTAVDNITVDTGLGRIEKLAGLGQEIKKVPEKRMAFTTLPVMDVPGEDPRVHVQPLEPKAGNLWAAVAADRSITEGDPNAPAAAPGAEAPPAATAPAAPVVDPATIKVSVRNTTTTPRATAVVQQLKTLRYDASVNNTKSTTPRANSSISFPAGKLDAAKQLAVAVGLPETAVDESPTAKTFEVVIGLDFPSAAPSTSAGPGTPASASPPPAAPSKDDLKLNTADNTSCIKTKKSK
ncbi:LCP family protein [Uniformispora flossi]|uniref:LCP family protein n=1 Tax=Uniformispora flossi TaxID=3390723 RepID=UPI003C2CF533